jgi:hypothetical protein
MGIAQSICKTNAKLAIKTEERTKWKNHSVLSFSAFNEIVASYDEIFTSFR